MPKSSTREQYSTINKCSDTYRKKILTLEPESLKLLTAIGFVELKLLGSLSLQEIS